MTSTDPMPTIQTSFSTSSGDQSTQALDPPTLPFVPTASNVADIRPSSARTSFTRVDHGDDEQPILPSSHDLAPPVPTSQDATSSSNVTHQAPELAFTLSQDQQQSVQRPPTPSTQPQVMLETVPQTPQTYLTFLLISGRRRTMSFEPELTIGRVKELAWNSWPTEWQDERPPAPSYLRVLYLGKMLQDDETLIGLKLPAHIPQPPTSPGPSSSGPVPTIMHLSIRPYAPPGEGDGLKKKKRRGANGWSPMSLTGIQSFLTRILLAGDSPGTNNEDGPESGTSCCCLIC
ncbi:hypothetical protein BYT27DRAFT_7119759 [Phlegmacium glaucopus]|nr:hypothetical protein BYT27DRAFT_7119759 [Phlegmacium glaucopus]